MDVTTISLIPPLDFGVLDSILHALCGEEGYTIAEATTRAIQGQSWLVTPAIIDLVHDSGTTLNDCRRQYGRGFEQPLMLFQAATLANKAPAALVEQWRDQNTDPMDAAFLDSHLSYAQMLLRGDPSGELFIESIVRVQLFEATDPFYRAGAEAAQSTFQSYFHIAELLYAALTTPPPTKVSSHDAMDHLTQEAADLMKSAASLARQPTIATASKQLLQKPQLLSSVWDTAARLVRVLRLPSKDFSRFMRDIRGLADDLRADLSRGISTEMLLGLYGSETSAMIARVDRTGITYTPGAFARDIAQLEARSASAEGSVQVLKTVYDWEDLTHQAALTRHTALWTAVCVACGVAAEKAYASTAERRCVAAALRAYREPLRTYETWQADSGTRFICAQRLATLINSLGQTLPLDPRAAQKELRQTALLQLEANERVYQRSQYVQSKERLRGRASQAVYGLLDATPSDAQNDKASQDALWEALVAVESTKSRALREAVALAKRPAPDSVPASLAQEEEQALQELRTILLRMAANDPEVYLQVGGLDNCWKRTRELRLHLERLWADMEDVAGDTSLYTALRRDDWLLWRGFHGDHYKDFLRSLDPDVGILSMSTASGVAYLLFYRAGWPAPRLKKLALGPEELAAAITTYNRDVHDFDELTSWSQLRSWREWRKENPPSHGWQRLGELLFTPISEWLDGINVLYLCTHGPLHQLPLHALSMRGRPLIEHCAVAYTPSLDILASCLLRSQRERSLQPQSPLVMAYDRAGSWEIEAEAQEIAAYFGQQQSNTIQGTCKVLRRDGDAAWLIHLSCHGQFLVEDPLASAVSLADGKFSGYDWLQRRLSAELVTLSACETGRATVDVGDELLGLSRAVLIAGASSVLATLWSVASKETREWMLSFYQHAWTMDGRSSRSKAEAFRLATLEVMARQPDPYYWAPFLLIGSHN